MTRQRRQPKEKEELTKDQFIERLSALIHAAAEATAAAYSVVVEITEFDRSVNVTDIEPRERPTVLWETISRAQQKAGESMVASGDLKRLIEFFEEGRSA
jgi:hypothetical protein